jgi:hypothetical protein
MGKQEVGSISWILLW